MRGGIVRSAAAEGEPCCSAEVLLVVPEIYFTSHTCPYIFTLFKKSNAWKPLINWLGGPNISTCLTYGVRSQGPQRAGVNLVLEIWVIKPSLMWPFSFPHPNHATSVHGLYGECQHGSGMHGLPARGCHQQNLWLGEVPGLQGGRAQFGSLALKPILRVSLSLGGSLEGDR